MSMNQKDDRPRTAPRPKIAVGTVGTKVNYSLSDTAFKPSDVPEQARRTKLELKRELQRAHNKLEPGREQWQDSVVVTKDIRPFCERKSRQLAAHEMPLLGQSYNYRAEVLPNKLTEFFPSVSKHGLSTATFMQRPATSDGAGTRSVWGRPLSPKLSERKFGEMSVHPKLENAKPWDTTTTISKKLMLLHNKRRDAAASKNSLKTKRRLNVTKRTPNGYLNPEARYRRKLRERRKILDSGGGTEFLDKVRTGTLNPPPPHKPKLRLATKRKPRKIKVA